MLGVFLQIGGLGFDFGNLLNQLEALGFFRYILPFLLIFAVVYALLSQIDVFKENRGASILIAVAIGLLALQLNFVSAFFQDIFPKVGIGIAILIIALIFAGAFIPGEKSFKWIFFGLGAAIFLVIVALSFSSFSFEGNWWWQQYGTLLIVGLVIVAAIVLVIFTSNKNSAPKTT
jgi:hypothetical protein